MFPSKAPLLYILQTLFIGSAVILLIALGMLTAQPAAALGILALQWMPQVPVVPSPDMMGDDEDDELGEYDGTPGFGMVPSKK